MIKLILFVVNAESSQSGNSGLSVPVIVGVVVAIVVVAAIIVVVVVIIICRRRRLVKTRKFALFILNNGEFNPV